MYLQIITSNSLPTTPEVNEENSHKNIPIADKPGNCLGCVLRCFRHGKYAGRGNEKSSGRDQREHFYKKNPMYDESQQVDRFLFRHSALHAFKYDEFYDCTKLRVLKEIEEEPPYVYKKSTHVSSSTSRIFTKRATSHVSLRRTKIEASIRKKYYPKIESRISHVIGVPQKRHNLYAYPRSYYETILKNLEREA